jgi:putative tryptophan/tyrosine transport system substrate-binding protein
MPGPVAALAQGGMRRLGVLMGGRGGADDALGQGLAGALMDGLGALNWQEGRNLRIDWRWAGGDRALYQRYAGELVSLASEVIVAHTSPAVFASRQETSTLPIVFAVVTDPLGQGFVPNLARPGGNITGFTDFDPPMAGKWLGMLTQITPPVAGVAVLYNPETAPFAGPMMRIIENAAPSMAITVRSAPVKDDADIAATMVRLSQEQRGGLLVLPDIFAAVHRSTIVTLAARYRLPAVYADRSSAAVGGLISYDTENRDLFRRTAAYVDRILQGAKAGDLPVQNPTKFKLVINLKTAQALGITIAPSLLAGADEVIE